ncbi:putative phospholipid hydroperoxide glutathione peroxidase [Dictyocoela muelleri]|nr:putative phospholipid hydroperoxide glutathione peroxidase [Dictyocoela muelleri]
MTIFYDLSARTWDGKNFNFFSLKGKPCVIVNIASKCGFHKQSFDMLNSIIDKNINILLFPCNQYLNQEPLNINEIHEYVQKFSDKYILFDKIKVFGNDQHAVYKYLTENSPSYLLGKSIKWNYTTFLIDEKGEMVKRYAPGENFIKDKCFIDVLQRNSGDK